MTKDEALKLALEALEFADGKNGWTFLLPEAIIAIKQALEAQPAVPLTEDEMWDLLGRHPKLSEYTRAVEARYGITKGQP
jgi:hypothetical protein